MKEKNHSKKAAYSFLFIAICSFIMSLCASNNPFHIGDSHADSSIFTYVGKLILHGGMPYRDTFDHKGPLMYLINALGLAVNEQIGIWIIELITITIIFGFSYKIARILGCSQFASCAVVAVNVLTLSYYFQAGNLVEEYACAFITVSCYIFVKFFIKDTVRPIELIICGASFAAVCLLRINMAALWPVMCIGVIIERIRKGKSKDIIHFILWFVLGMAIVAVPILLWLSVNGAFPAFVEDYFKFNFMYSSDPVRASKINVIKAIYYFASGSPMLISLPILIYFCISKRDLLNWLIMFTAALSLLFMCVSGQSSGYEHYGMILCPLVVFSVSELLSELSLKGGLRSKNTKAAVVFSLTAACVLVFTSSEFVLARAALRVIHPATIFPDEREAASVIRENTNEDDLIFVTGNKDIIYLLSDRYSASIYSYQYPIANIDPGIKSAYLSDLEQKQPKMIVFADEEFFDPGIDEILDNGYKKISTIGKYNLYLFTDSK